jgi:hypothetical protein
VSIDAVDLAAASGLQLVKVPPPIRYGVGRIELRIGRQILGDIDIMLCPVDRNGVIEHVRTDHRRLGYGRLLVAAARTLGPDYRWTTTTIQPTLAAKAFWASVGWDGIGEPHYCSHQLAGAAVEVGQLVIEHVF